MTLVTEAGIEGYVCETVVPIAGWLSDSRHLVARLAGGAGLIDTTNSPWRIIAPAESGDVVRLSRNGRVLLVEHEILDADIWLIELP